jgi:sugar O-acyltransferase (sialic acid O-acetyltransferase NeuD family)
MVSPITMNPSNAPQTNPTLVVFGVGGHGRVVADAAMLQGRWLKVVATARSLPPAANELLSGVKILAMDHAVQQVALVHIAIGNNTARQTEARALGIERLVSVVHPRASVSAFSHMGEGCFVAAGAVVAPAAKVGIGVIVNHGAVIDHDTDIGDFSHIAQNASVCGHAKLGQRVLIGSGAVVLSSVVLGDDVVLSPGSVANCDLLVPGVYSGIPAVKIE